SFFVQTGTLYSLGSFQYTHQLDGKQPVMVTIAAMQRLDILRVQLSLIGSPWISPIGKAISYIGTGSCLFFLFKEPLLKLARRCKIDWLAKHVDQLADFVVRQMNSYSDRLVGVASITSYLALCILGFPVQGGMGLVGLALLELKKRQCLPEVIDRCLK